MVEREERFSATVGLILALIWFPFIILIPETSLHIFVERHLSPDGHINPETILQITRLRLLGSILASALGAVSIYFLLKGISLFSRLRKVSGFYWVSYLVCAGVAVNLFLNLPPRSLTAAMGLLVAALLGQYLIKRRKATLPTLDNLLKKRIFLVASWSALVFLSLLAFFIKFPFKQMNRPIFQDDYGNFFYNTILDLECLKEGYLYGWDKNFLGGYPTFLNLRSLLIPYLPFAWLPPQMGFHLLILFWFVAFPLLVYFCARSLSAHKALALLSSWLAFFFSLSYFQNILKWGMVPSLISVGALLLALIFLKRFIGRKKWSGLLLLIVLAAAFFVHIPHFAGIIFFLSIFLLAEKLWAGEEIPWLKICVLMVALFCLTVPLFNLLLRFRSYLASYYYYAPPPVNLKSVSSRTVSSVIHSLPILKWSPTKLAYRFDAYLRLVWLFIPVWFYFLWRRRGIFRTAALLCVLLLVASLLRTEPVIGLIFMRLDIMAAPFVLSLLFALWLQESKRKALLISAWAVVMVLLLFVQGFAKEFETVGHIDEVSAFNPPLIQRMKGLNGHLVLFENSAMVNPKRRRNEAFDKPPPPHVHLATIIQRATNRSLFSDVGYDPYPYHIIRDTYIVNGTYRGEDLQKMPIEEMNQILQKWGVKFLVVWSGEAKSYFGGYPLYYQIIYADPQFAIFEFLEAEPRSVVTKSGQSEIISESHFEINLGLKSVKAGERVILRYNYFPLWRAFWQNGEKRQEIELVDYDGQISFISPAPGDYTVHLVFPKEWWWLLPGGVALGGLFVASWKGYI